MSGINFREAEPWNMNQVYLVRLNNRLDERDKFAEEGNLLAWYRTLKTIYRNIHWKVKQKGSEKEEKELDDKFDKVKATFLNLSKGKNPVERLMQANNLSAIEISLDEIDMKLNDLLVQYNLIILEKPQKEPGRVIVSGKFGD